MQHVDKYGIGRVMEMTLDHLKGRPLHCSYDIDGVDPAVAPSELPSPLITPRHALSQTSPDCGHMRPEVC